MPDGKQQHDEHAQPEAKQSDPAQPVGQGQRSEKSLRRRDKGEHVAHRAAK